MALSKRYNVISGPNEAGKATLVRAIRAAFFERHRFQVGEGFAASGVIQSAAPTIELVFIIDGQNCS